MQDSFNSNVALGWSEIIIGFRNLPWAGDFNWTGEHELVIDYFKVEYLNTLSTTSTDLEKNDVSIFPNPAYDELNVKSKNFHQIKNIIITNAIGAEVLKIDSYQDKIDISNLPKGLYFINSIFNDGKIVSKKLMKR